MSNNSELNVNLLCDYAESYKIPIEDVVFIALNYAGVHMDVSYNRMRMGFHLDGNVTLFNYANSVNDLNYYFALPINHNSPFKIIRNKLFLQDYYIGTAIGATEDFCDSHYPRRLGTSLNINPNSRTSCRGCTFCYTAYQVPLDREKMKNANDIRKFFVGWIKQNNCVDLSHLIQVSVVTGCYDSEEDLVVFLLNLKNILDEFNFSGKIFYLGSMLTTSKSIQKLRGIKDFGYCISIECFEKRDILIGSKESLTLEMAKVIMSECLSCGFEVNYTYVIGLENLEIMLSNMKTFLKYTNKFPTINILQLHSQHNKNLLDTSVIDITFLYKARKEIETIYKDTTMRPLVWEDYRSLWYLKFMNEELRGDRFPEFFWKDKISNNHLLEH